MSDLPSLPQSSRADPAQAVQVTRQMQGGVVTLTFGGPLGNRLNPELIAKLGDALAQALDDPATRAIVLSARGADFCAGPSLDLPPPTPDDPGVPAFVPALAALCARIDSARRPVVAALHGRVLGGGLAIALACHARIADARAQFHFPELALARLPGGNGTVRLGWLLGAEAAWGFLNTRLPLSASQAQGIGLIDATVSEGVVAAAVTRADTLGAVMTLPARSRPGTSHGAQYMSAIRAARASLPQPLPPQRAVQALALDVLEAALLLPPDQALAFDQTHAEEAAARPEARAHAHILRALHRAPETPETRLDPSLLQVPSGAIALALDAPALRLWVPALLRADLAVIVTGADAQAVETRLNAASDAILDEVVRGKIAADQGDALRQRLRGLPYGALQGVVLGLCELRNVAPMAQALPESDLLVWGAQGAALAEAGAAHGARVVGVMPPPMIPDPPALPRLIEIVVPQGARAQTRARAHALCLRLRSTPLRSGGVAIVPRMIQAGRLAARRLVECGVTQDNLRTASPLPMALLLPSTPSAGEPQDLPLPVDRLLHLALINEGARLLQEGRALRPSDIDLAMILGAGFPRWLGGPMAVADSMGVLVLRHELTQAARLDPAIWSPVALLDEMVRESLRFGELNSAE